MWLERLSGQSTPSASTPTDQLRSHSPAPHRSSHLAPRTAPRPPYGPRTSSLGLASQANTSTLSLNSPKLPNGSSLKQQVAPPPVFVDPLHALRDILGQGSDHGVDGGNDKGAGALDSRPTSLVEEVDFGGLSLHAFARDVDPQEPKEAHRSATQTVEECE